MRAFAAVATAVCGLVTLAAPAHAQAPTYASLEGGLACSNNKPVLDDNVGFGLGKKGCGGTVTAEVGAIGRPVFSVLDLWAIRGRYTSFQDKVNGDFAGDQLQTTFTDRRIVLDAEVGKKSPFGMFGGTSYVTFGVRYASWSGEGEFKMATDSVIYDLKTSGIGPRIGLRSSIPLGTHFMLESRSGAAALFSRHSGEARLNGSLESAEKSNSTVFSIDSSTALSYKLDGTETGRVASIGLVSEYWFGQSRFDGVKDNRHSWGPVARFRMPLQ